jgi:hypothetical protein
MMKKQMWENMTTFYEGSSSCDLNPTQHHFGGTGRKIKPWTQSWIEPLLELKTKPELDPKFENKLLRIGWIP